MVGDSLVKEVGHDEFDRTDEKTPGDSIVREIGHDEFDPKGTIALILTYMVILLVMWGFMYFVEFLGNDLTVIG